MRVGFGYDVHRLVEGRLLMLGGKQIPYPRGLSGHSDADVLLHAVMDALLGAACLGDIGRHFPPTDPALKGISSLKLLSMVGELLLENGFAVSNIDATVVCEEPRISPHASEMAENISKTLKCPSNRVNIKGTTEEGMGTTGGGEAISAYAVALIESRR